MKLLGWVFILLTSTNAFGAYNRLTLDEYLDQVRTQSPEGRQLAENIVSAELRIDEAELALTPQGYGEFGMSDNRMQPPVQFQARRTIGERWRFGARDQTTFGLSTDVFMTNTHTNIIGVNPAFFPLREYHQPAVGIELTQSFWRNGFGKATRAELKAQQSASRMNLMKHQFAMKNLMLKAKNTYWSLVSIDQIINLQKENVDRAKKLSTWMSSRADMRLMDDVDALQAQASLETREMELQVSIDDQAVLLRQFNTLRAAPNDSSVELSDLPSKEDLLKIQKTSGRMSREDFKIAFEDAEMQKNQAIASKSKILPQLDLKGKITTNGLSGNFSEATERMWTGAYPAWEVGVSISFPLDLSLLGNLKNAFDAQNRATDESKQNAKFTEERFWQDVTKQQAEAQVRFHKALKLEQLQTKLVKKEQQRLRNGRTTTFQTIGIEQNLALAQIQRVRNQLALLQIHNVIESFEQVPGEQQ